MNSLWWLMDGVWLVDPFNSLQLQVCSPMGSCKGSAPRFVPACSWAWWKITKSWEMGWLGKLDSAKWQSNTTRVSSPIAPKHQTWLSLPLLHINFQSSIFQGTLQPSMAHTCAVDFFATSGWMVMNTTKARHSAHGSTSRKIRTYKLLT